MRRWIIIVVVLVVIGAAGFFYIQSQGGIGALTGGNEANTTPTPLPAVQANPEVIVDAVVVPLRFAELSMPASGIVADILVEEGATVDQGQLLAQLDNERQVIAIAQSEARVRSAQARLEELRAGSRIEEIAASQAALDIARANLANLVVGVRPEDVSSAEADLVAAEANLEQVLDGADDADLISALAEISNAEATLRQAQRCLRRCEMA